MPKQWPKSEVIEDEFGTYRLDVSVAGGRVKIEESFVLKEPEIELSKYASFRAFAQKISAARSRPFGFVVPRQ